MSASSWFYYNTFNMMHGHLNVKFVDKKSKLGLVKSGQRIVCLFQCFVLLQFLFLFS